MEEYARIDPNVHNYQEIMPEDVWQYNVVQKMGVQNLTAELYMEKVYNMKKGDKPWFVCMINFKPTQRGSHATYLMKSLYFLQRDFQDKAIYAYVDPSDELIREVFDYEVIPQCVYIKDGKPYYVAMDVIGVNSI